MFGTAPVNASVKEVFSIAFKNFVLAYALWINRK
jgi:hypothetical protein